MGVHSCMFIIAAFMLVYGAHLCWLTRGNTIAEFPWLSVGVVYLPIPLGGLLTLLFLLEKIWLGEPPKSDVMYSDQVWKPNNGCTGSARVLRAAVRARRAGRLCGLGLSALIAAAYAEILLEAVMIKISDGTDDFVLLAILFFVLAGGIMAEGGMAARLSCSPRCSWASSAAVWQS